MAKTWAGFLFYITESATKCAPAPSVYTVTTTFFAQLASMSAFRAEDHNGLLFNLRGNKQIITGPHKSTVIWAVVLLQSTFPLCSFPLKRQKKKSLTERKCHFVLPWWIQSQISVGCCIHPFSNPRSDFSGSRLSKVLQASSSPSLPRDPESPGPTGICNPSGESWANPGAWAWLEVLWPPLRRKTSWRHPDQTQEQQRHCKLPPGCPTFSRYL